MRTSHIGACVFALAAALAAAATFAPTPSFAQVTDCAAKPAVDLDLATLKSGGDKTRIATANTLVNQWSTTLPTIMVALTGFSPSTTGAPNVQQDYFLSIVDVLRSILANNTDAIRVFRICRSDAMIKPLVRAARGEHPGIRVNAMLILGNVIDNTTVCSCSTICVIRASACRAEPICSASRSRWRATRTRKMLKQSKKRSASSIRESRARRAIWHRRTRSSPTSARESA